MKKTLSSLLLVFTFPFRLLKKTKVDNFVGGLIFGAIFSLVVNIATVQVQELIQKQRILEAIENEIVSNLLRADNILKTNNDALEKGTPVNYFYVAPEYSSDLWSQSSEPLQYVAQLDQRVQSGVIIYYSITVRNSNDLVGRTNEVINRTMDLCFDFQTFIMKDSEECKLWNRMVRDVENSSARLISGESLKLLEIFHPTQDRLKSKFLRFMMGDKSMRILSGD